MIEETPTDRTQVQTSAPPAAMRLGLPTIPGYEIARELGRGGMGVVYEARQTMLDRVVALKVTRDDDPLGKARFLAEGQVIAAVKHPHVVAVYDFGEVESAPYIAMELLPGGSLSDRLKASRFEPTEAAELIAKIAEGVGAAHGLAIVHRDLKPGNVLFTSDDVPKVTDFGLAKRSTSDLTRTQDAAGTPAYMAPEQARALKFVGPPADVWSLGVMLYEALAGRRPFEAATDLELLTTIQAANPPTLRSVAGGGIPRDLETICLKCLEKEPERRYATANELAADLTAWREGRPIAAKRATVAERAMLWVRRKPTLAAACALGVLVVVLTAFAATATALWREAVVEKGIAVGLKGDAESARDAAEQAQQRAETSEQLAKDERKKVDDTNAQLNKTLVDLGAERDRVEKLSRKLQDANTTITDERERLAYARNLSFAHAEYRGGEVARAKMFLDLCPPKHRGWDWNYVHRLCNSDQVTLNGHISAVWSAAFSSDGTKVVTASSDNSAIVWDAPSGKLLVKLTGHVGIVDDAAFSFDGAKVVTAAQDHAAIWNAKTGQRLLSLKGHTSFVRTAAFSPDGSKVVTGGSDNACKVWDAKTGEELFTYRHSNPVFSVAFTADGKSVLSVADDNRARVWDATTGKVAVGFTGYSSWVRSAWLTRDGNLRAVTGTDTGPTAFWDGAENNQLFELKGHAATVRRADADATGARIVTASPDQTARVWDAKTGKELLVLKGHTGAVYSARFSPDGTRIVTASADNTAKIWSASGGPEPLAMKGHPSVVRALAFSPDGARLATASNDGTIRIADPVTGELVRSIPSSRVVADFVAFSPDGERVVAGGRNGLVTVFDAKTGRSKLVIEAHKPHGHSAVFSPDGRSILTSGFDKLAILWDATTGDEIRPFVGHTAPVNAAAFSPDGARIATAGSDFRGRIWDAKTGKETAILKGHASFLNGIAFSPDSTRVATAGADSTARVWDAATGELLLTLIGHTDDVRTIAFNADGTRLLTASDDKTAKLWDAKVGNETLTLAGHGDRVSAAAFSPDGRRVATASEDKTVKVWDAGPAVNAAAPDAARPPIR
jgi:eukaryotic-like serine/threonine-protein kinase